MMKLKVMVIQNFFKRMSKDHVSAYASQAAYFVLVSIFPFLLLLMTLIPYTPLNKQEIIDAILLFIPENFQGMILGVVNEVYAKSLAVVPVTAIAALWSAGKGVQALTNGLNCIYGVEETRNFLVTRFRAILYTLIFIFAIVMTLILLVFGNGIQIRLTKYFPGLFHVLEMIIGLRTIVTLLILTVVFLLLYKFIPNQKRTIKSQLPGAIFTSMAWSLASFGFSLYFDLKGGIGNMYGSMTGILLVLLWMYICMYLIMLGAELNSALEGKIRLTDE
ncbi:MAG: YihY/virulence factor BrkB family protein [Lachnospiraceae bacterium]|jgi:membrane protein